MANKYIPCPHKHAWIRQKKKEKILHLIHFPTLQIFCMVTHLTDLRSIPSAAAEFLLTGTVASKSSHSPKLDRLHFLTVTPSSSQVLETLWRT